MNSLNDKSKIFKLEKDKFMNLAEYGEVNRIDCKHPGVIDGKAL